MKSIVEEKLVSFKSLEQKVFRYVCEMGRETTWIMLESYDAELAEKIVMTVMESPYRVAADIISGTCGQSISHGGAWNLVQKLGERVNEEEEHAVKQMDAGQAKGEAMAPVLFEEMNGVWLCMQDSKHKRMKKQEMKVFTMYEGWAEENGGRSCLVEKEMLAGMEKSDEFHRKREALIEKKQCR